MSNDTKAACERWPNRPPFYYDNYRKDAATLADAYCALFDETPIDEEFAAEVNGWIGVSGELVRYMDEWRLMIDNDRGAMDVCGPFTTCQVRLLLLAMGVER